jgi:hypothetical protein
MTESKVRPEHFTGGIGFGIVRGSFEDGGVSRLRDTGRGARIVVYSLGFSGCCHGIFGLVRKGRVEEVGPETPVEVWLDAFLACDGSLWSW